MTIGIATRGPQAGLAAWRALLAAELLGRGEIGGFGVFAWRDANGALHHASTQRGGTLGLTLTGDWANATHAALISSGPDRAEPLVQFLPGDPAVGLVTGHRLPSSPLPDGRPLNLAALAAMRQGLTQDGLETLLAQGPAMDAGLICLPWQGPILMANSPRVAGRDDLGRYLMQDATAACAILHNSIYAARLHGNALATALGAIAAEAMGLGAAPLALARLPDRLPVIAADHEAVDLDASGTAIALHSADPAYFGPKPSITAIHTSIPVRQAGRLLGHAVTEAFADLRGGQLIGRPGVALRSFLYRRSPQ